MPEVLVPLDLKFALIHAPQEPILAPGHPSANHVRQERIHLSELSIVSSVKTAELVNLFCLLVLLVRTLFVMYALQVRLPLVAPQIVHCVIKLVNMQLGRVIRFALLLERELYQTLIDQMLRVVQPIHSVLGRKMTVPLVREEVTLKVVKQFAF